jgi:ABC-type multidrug transport system ATPase subunit
MNEIFLNLQNISKKYDTRYALRNISYQFKSNNIYGILGTNGAGKSTMLKLIFGILLPTNGDILLNNVSIVNDHNTMKKIAGFLPELPMLNDYLTVQETLFGTMRLRGFSQNDSILKVNEYIKWINLTDYKDELIINCSKGIKQKVAFGIATMHNPSIYLFDEPFMGLDPSTVFLLKKWMADIKDQNKIIIVTSHISSIIEEIADQVVVINSGNIVKTGVAKQICNDTSSENLEEALFKILNSVIK